MAQVKKYSKGNQVSKVKLFNYEGIGDYNVDDLTSAYANSINNELSQLDLGDEDKQKILEVTNNIMRGIQSGDIKGRNMSGHFILPENSNLSSSGINEKKKFLGISTGKYKKDEDFYKNTSYALLDKIFKGVSTYTSPKEKSENPSEYKLDFGKVMNDYYFNGTGFDPERWDYSNALNATVARLDDEIKKIQSGNYSNKEDILSRLNDTKAALLDKDPSNDAVVGSRIGFDFRPLFNKNYEIKPKTEEEIKAEETAAEAKKVQELQNKIQEEIKNNRESGESYYFKFNPLKPSADIFKKYNTLEEYSKKYPVNWASWNDSNSAYNSNSFWAYFDDAKMEDLKNAGFYENNYYYLPESVDEKQGSIFRFNRDTNTMEKVPLSFFKKGIEKLTYNVEKSMGLKKPWEYKSGGNIIKAQQGWYVDQSNKIRSAKKRAQEQALENIQKEEERKTELETGFKNSNNPHTEFSNADKVRMGALAGDLASLIASMTGVGSVASAGLGAASTTANLSADMMEGKSFGEAFANNLGSYAMDIVSLIPFAKAAKVPKMIKTLGTWAPKITGAIAGIQGLNNSEEYLKSWGKVTNGESLTVGDWRNISESLQLVLGGAAATHRASVANSNVQSIRSTDKVWIKSNQGWKKIDSDLAKKVSEAPDLKAQNELLKNEGITLSESTNWRFKGKGKNDVKTADFYDFDKQAKRYSGDLELTHNFGRGERVLGNLQLPDFNFPRVRNVYNRVVHPVAYKKNKSNSSEAISNKKTEEPVNNTSTNTTQKKTLLASPAPSRRRDAKYRLKNNSSRSNSSIEMPQDITKEKRSIIGKENLNSSKSEVLYTPIKDNSPTVSWDKAYSNYSAVQKLKADRAANKSKIDKENKERKELNRLIDKENKDKSRIKKEQETVNWWLRELNKKEQTSPKRGPVNLSESEIQNKQDYVNWWLNELSNQARVLPKKQKKVSNTKKKTQGNKGYVNKKQEGGIMKFQIPSGPITNIKAKDMSKWNRNNAIAGYNMAKDIEDYLKTGSDIDSYMAAFNGGEDLYDKMVGNTDYFSGKNVTYTEKNPLAYQRQLTFRTTNKGFDDFIRGSIVGYGTTEGNTGYDMYLGDRTYNRTLGRITEDQANAFNTNQLNKYGIEFYLDPGSGHYRLRRTPAVKLPEVEVTPSPETPQPTVVNSLGKYTPISDSKKASPSIRWDDVIGTGRLLGTISTNNSIAKGLKSSLSPLLLDPLQIRRQVTGDLATRNYMENLGAEANRIGNKPITSDANLALAQALDYNNRAGEYRIKGYLADKEAIDRTTAEARQAAEQNQASRVETANRNRASMLGIQQAKANIEAQRKSANWAQAIAPWLMDKEMKVAENRKINNELDYQENQYSLSNTMRNAVDMARQDMENAKSKYLSVEGNTEDGWKNSTEYKNALSQYNKAIDTVSNNYKTGMINARRNIYKYNPFLFVGKSGGKLSYSERALLDRAKDFNKSLLSDRKLFHKIVSDSQKENNKLLMSLSGLTKELIIKSMTI